MPRPKTSTTPRGSSAKCRPDKRVHTRGIEVGQIFYFGTKYSDTMKAMVAGADGAEVADPWRLLRRRRVAAGRRHHRGLP